MNVFLIIFFSLNDFETVIKLLLFVNVKGIMIVSCLKVLGRVGDSSSAQHLLLVRTPSQQQLSFTR